MFVIEFKVKIVLKISKKIFKFVEVEVFKVVFDVVQVEYVLVFVLVKFFLNVRIIFYLVEKVCLMVDFIEVIGLLQNLVVYNFLDGCCGVVVGGCCLKVLQFLQSENCIDVGYQVMVKKVFDELVVVVLMVENEQQMVMYLFEQIVGFCILVEQGKIFVQIGDLLGFGMCYVQCMLKLIELVFEILVVLVKDEIIIEYCQVLVFESDQKCQVEVLEFVCKWFWNNEVLVFLICNFIILEEVFINGDKFCFVGEVVFSLDEIWVDFFSSENCGYVKSVLFDIVLLEKLQNIVEYFCEVEGWLWCDGCFDLILYYGKDIKIWCLYVVLFVEYIEVELECFVELEVLEVKYEDENFSVNDDVVVGVLEVVWEEQQIIVYWVKYWVWMDEMK